MAFSTPTPKLSRVDRTPSTPRRETTKLQEGKRQMDNIMGWMLLAAVTIGVGAVAVGKGEAIMETLSAALDSF